MAQPAELTARSGCDIPCCLVDKQKSQRHESTTVDLTSVLLAALAAAGGATALDVLRGQELSRFLPHGVFSLWVFVGCLYGAVFSICALVCERVVFALTQATLLRVLWRGSSPLRLSRLHQALIVFVPPLLIGLSLYPIARLLLHLFHHRGLIALLSATVAAGLTLPALAVTLLVQPLLPRGEHRHLVLQKGPLSLYAIGWAVGLLLFAGGEALLLWRLFDRPKMDGPLRALNLALWTPLVWLLAMAIGHGLGRTLAQAAADKWPVLRSRAALLGLPLGMLGLSALGVWLGYRTVLSQIDLRAFFTLAVAGTVALVWLWRGPTLSLGRARFALLLIPCVLWFSAVQLGQRERVRKAAQAGLPLSARLLHVISHVFDIDRDGVASRFAIGGSDCDDFDPDIYPGAFDWPDDGIDQNCNGHDAHPQTARPVAAPLPDKLPKRPNVVLITVDALRADHMSSYGYARKTTPQIDALLADPDTVLFENAWSHAPSTRYSVPAILSGRYPSQIAWGSPWSHWPPEVLPQNRLLSELYRDAGYHTLALLPYHYFEPTWGLARGFVDYDHHLQVLHSLGGDPSATSGSSARELTDLAEQKLRPLLASDQPFFVWMHYYDPHFRYEPHPPPPGEASFGDRETDLYDGEIRYTDQQMGRLFKLLSSSPAWNRTVVLLTADHGEGLGEHAIPPDKRHGYHLYANQTRVPLIVRVPGLSTVNGQKKQGAAVGHVDILPTLTALSSLPLPAEASGQSLWPLLLGYKSPDPRVVFQEVMYEGPTVRKAVVDGRYHFIENLIPDGTRELYDLTNDPGEDHDLQGERSADEKRLRDLLSAWMDDGAVPADFAELVGRNLSKQPLPAPIRTSARIGKYLELIGIDVRTKKVRRGDHLEVAAVLRCDERIPAGYKLFVHLKGSGGAFANGDHDFLSGYLSPQKLKPGSYLRDVTRLQVPAHFPPGKASLQIGLYRRAERVEVSGDPQVAQAVDRSLRLGTIDIE